MPNYKLKKLAVRTNRDTTQLSSHQSHPDKHAASSNSKENWTIERKGEKKLHEDQNYNSNYNF